MDFTKNYTGTMTLVWDGRSLLTVINSNCILVTYLKRDFKTIQNKNK